jgi:hypothetical protein
VERCLIYVNRGPALHVLVFYSTLSPNEIRMSDAFIDR